MAKPFYPQIGITGSAWTPSPHATWVQSSWPFNTADGIDLRKELHAILHGDGNRSGKGHWIVYRKFDRSTYSQYYNEVTQEAVGGPKYEYTDYIIRAYRSNPLSGLGANNSSKEADVGQISIPTVVYYLEYDQSPQVGDQIFELNWESPIKPTTIVTQNPNYFRERFNIEFVHAYRLDGWGRIEYWYCGVERNIGKW